MNDKTYTLTLTEQEVKMLYRASMMRSVDFKTDLTDDIEEYRSNLRIADRYERLAKGLIQQSGVKL